MIIFNKIRYKNILSTGNKFVEINLNKNPTTLIIGKNGSGKSQMIDALTFALYGKAFRKIILAQLVNSINKKKLVVELEFTIGTTNFKIERGLYPATFKIYIDNVLKKQEAAYKDYQKYLENNILKMSEKTFRQIVVLGSTSYIPFMRLTTGDRRLVVEDLMDIQVFSLMNFIIKNRTSNIEDKYNEVLNNLKILNNSLELKKQHLKEMKGKTVEQIEDNNIEIEKNNNRINDIKKNIDDIRSEIKLLSNNIIDKKELENSKSKIDGFRIQIKSNIDKYDKRINFLKDSTHCPTCEQQIEESFKVNHICETNKKKDISLSGLTKARNEINKITSKLNDIQNILISIQGKEKDIYKLNGELSTLNTHISKLISDNKKLIGIDNSFFDESVLDDIVKEINKYKEERNNKSSDLYYYSIIIELLKDSGIKSKIIRSYLPIINKLIRKYLDILEFNIDFRFDESFTETIISRNRYNFSYANFSEGEKMRIDLCLLFTWRELSRLRNSAATNILIFDEIGDSSLDSEGFEAFMKIIDESAKNQNVFIISHKGDIMTDKFRDVIRFDKVGNFTEIK